jgi:hypothetical protein
MFMASGDIYVQITATPEKSASPKSIVVFVLRTKIENHKLQISGKKAGDHEIAKELADPFALNLFTHRASFGPFKVAYAFSSTAPPEIKDKSPEFSRDGLEAWVL